MFRFTQTIIRELQPVLCQSYNTDSNTQFVVEVFSIMAAYATIILNTSTTNCVLESIL